ncbi:MAG: hypothetical protein R2774_09135 [Saprospiraceae bacterium]
MKITFWVITLVLCFFISGQSQIFIDENYSDWENNAASFSDVKGDGGNNGLDIEEVRISNDESRLFLYIKLNKEINLQSNQNLSVAIDFDNNINTGSIKNGVGAELTFNFGDRIGQLFLPNLSTFVYHNHLGLVSAPTVTSKIFEISINRKIIISNVTTGLQNNIKVAFYNDVSGGDKAPDTGGFNYTLNDNIFSAPNKYNFQKGDDDFLRVMSYNVLQDNIFISENTQAFKRIAHFIDPDIYGFCEIYDHKALDVVSILKSALPNVTNWFTADVNPDIRVVSKYPITSYKAVDGNGLFVIKKENTSILFIMAHLPCCENDEDRQNEIDKLMSFIRDIRYGISSIQIPMNSPIIIAGDMNLVGYNSQLKSFITGDIDNNSLYGPDFKPDWDNTYFTDLQPFVIKKPFCFTWNNGFSSYPPGRLDFMFYSDSQLNAVNAFTFDSQSLTAQEQAEAGVQFDDCTTVSDHLPIISDFEITSTTQTIEAETNTVFRINYHPEPRIILSEEQTKGYIQISNTLGHVIDRIKMQSDKKEYLLFEKVQTLNKIWLVSLVTQDKIYTQKVFY